MAFFMRKIISLLIIFVLLTGGAGRFVSASQENTERAETVQGTGRFEESEGTAEMSLTDSELYSKSAALMDGSTKRVLFGKEESIPLANASTTKILTCIVALEAGVLSDTTMVSSRAVRQPKVRLGMTEGTEYKIKDLLYCLMLESFNDCAVAIAEHVAGSVEEFAQMMNQKALEIGCQDTYFITPNGLDDENENGFHHTTAEDLCRIMAYCSWDSPKAAEFCEITQTMSYSFENNGNSYTASNHNQLFSKIHGVVSGKTGFTADAGYCYVASFERDGKKMCLALLGCGWPNNKNYKWADSLKLLEYGLTNYKLENIYEPPFLEKQAVLEGISLSSTISNWRQNCYLDGYIEAEPELNYLVSLDDAVSYEVQWKEEMTAPIEEGEILGYHLIFMNEECVYSEPIKAGRSVEKWSFFVFFELVCKEFILF